MSEQIDPSLYKSPENFAIALDVDSIYSCLTRISANELVLLCRIADRNLLELRRIETNDLPLIRSIDLSVISSSIDDLTWSTKRDELLLIADGHLFVYNLNREEISQSLLIDAEKNKSRLACNSTLIACVDSRTLKLFDLFTLNSVRHRRLDHLCEDIEFDDQYFLSTHTGKLEILDRSFFSIRRFPVGGTSICRFNSKLWLIADAFDDRLLWQSLEKVVYTLTNIHQPKSIVVDPRTARLFILCHDPNRLLIFDPSQ